MNIQLKSYKKEFEYSYSFGAFPTIELLKYQPEIVHKVILSSAYTDNLSSASIYEICGSKNIEIEVNDKMIGRLSPKENCYVIGVFKKYTVQLNREENHLVLVNPSNMGNLGTIIRTSIGFGINNLAIIRPAVDIFDPKVIRASMGAMFKLRFHYFDTFSDYMENSPNHDIYTFMLNAKVHLQNVEPDSSRPFSLVFGNEASGLSDEFLNYGTSVVIPHSEAIDSLNLPIAVGIANYEFAKKWRK